MPERKILICNKLGLHARAASKFVTTASRFESHVEVTNDGNSVNGKSIMGVLTLAAAKGAELTLTVDGNDADEALDALSALVENKFGEDE